MSLTDNARAFAEGGDRYTGAEVRVWVYQLCDEIERLRQHAVILAATAEEVERERCATLCENAKSTIWELHDPAIKQAGQNVCDNLAAAIRSQP